MERTKINNEKLIMLENELYSDSVTPHKRSQMQRKLDMFGNVELRGGIFSQSLSIEADDIFVEKAVYVEEGIVIKGKKDSLVWFNSPVNANHSIVVEEGSGVRVRFGNTIRSQSLNLKNTIVYGNVLAKNVVLNDSIVLGAVYAQHKLSTNNSILGTFHCNELCQKGNLGILHPLAISDNAPDITGKLYMVVPGSASQDSGGAAYEMDHEDIYPLDYNNNRRFIFSSTMKIFDLRLYQQNLIECLGKLVESANLDLNDLAQAKQRYADFEKQFFVFIDSNFLLPPTDQYSDFIKLEYDEIRSYLEITQENEADLQSKDPAALREKNAEASNDASAREASPELDPAKYTHCPACQEVIDASLAFCTHCGAKLQANGVNKDIPVVESGSENFWVCKNCGAKMGSRLTFCTQCGHKA